MKTENQDIVVEPKTPIINEVELELLEKIKLVDNTIFSKVDTINNIAKLHLKDIRISSLAPLGIVFKIENTSLEGYKVCLSTSEFDELLEILTTQNVIKGSRKKSNRTENMIANDKGYLEYCEKMVRNGTMDKLARLNGKAMFSAIDGDGIERTYSNNVAMRYKNPK
jgi:hypothetical protein